jgi:hypothetical protein
MSRNGDAARRADIDMDQRRDRRRNNADHRRRAGGGGAAIRFKKAFGVKADTLLRMQTAYELAQARAHEGSIKVKRFANAA